MTQAIQSITFPNEVSQLFSMKHRERRELAAFPRVHVSREWGGAGCPDPDLDNDSSWVFAFVDTERYGGWDSIARVEFTHFRSMPTRADIRGASFTWTADQVSAVKYVLDIAADLCRFLEAAVALEGAH